MGDHYLPRLLLKGFARAPARAKGHPVVVTYDLDGMQSGEELTIAAVANETGMYGSTKRGCSRTSSSPRTSCWRSCAPRAVRSIAPTCRRSLAT